MKRLALITAVVAVTLAVAGPAYGQSAVGDAYGGNGAGILGAVDSGGGNNSGGGNSGGGTSQAPAPAQVQAVTTESGSLPFTGLDVGLLAIGGVLFVIVGVGVRRFARPLS